MARAPVRTSDASLPAPQVCAGRQALLRVLAPPFVHFRLASVHHLVPFVDLLGMPLQGGPGLPPLEVLKLVGRRRWEHGGGTFPVGPRGFAILCLLKQDGVDGHLASVQPVGVSGRVALGGRRLEIWGRVMGRWGPQPRAFRSAGR
jgi:hypothetical protein